jgi:hypothetical protein
MVSDFFRLQSELNDRKVDLIKSDLQTASTFVTIAEDADNDSPKRSRNRKNARKGHDTVLHFLESAMVSDAERSEANLRKLKRRLIALGEKFDS